MITYRIWKLQGIARATREVEVEGRKRAWGLVFLTGSLWVNTKQKSWNLKYGKREKQVGQKVTVNEIT